jgi:hypothetical protein
MLKLNTQQMQQQVSSSDSEEETKNQKPSRTGQANSVISVSDDERDKANG